MSTSSSVYTAKRKRDKAERDLWSAEHVRVLNGIPKAQRVEEAHKTVEEAERELRVLECKEAWELAENEIKSPIGPAHAIFAAGIVQAHAMERAAKRTSKEIESAAETIACAVDRLVTAMESRA